MSDALLRDATMSGELLLWIGGAPSIAAGLPDTVTLARELLDYAARADSSIDVVSLTQWLELRPADVLEQLQHSLGAEFQREVERRLSDQGRAVPDLARAVAAVRKQLKAIYTTRLDRVLERALECAWPTFADARPGLVQRSRLVFKICGTLEFHPTWVLTREQRERELGPGSPRRRLLEAAFAAHRILFVGFEADRAELRWLLDLLPTYTDGSGPEHVIALPGCTPDERQQLERRGLRVLQQDALGVLSSLAAGATSAAQPNPHPVPAHACPYPGLEAFTETKTDVFFGRHAEVSEAASRLGTQGERERRWLSVEGPSGVGKSSFARAGIVPALRRGFAPGTPSTWRAAVMRPGADPMASLAEATAEALGIDDRPGVQRAIAQPGGFVQLLRQRVPADVGFVLVVDQLEETVTTAQAPARNDFATAVADAVDARALYLVTTARSDFIPALQRGLPALLGRLNDAAERYLLPPISRAGLREAICEPAARRSITIEPALVERLLLDSGPGPSKGPDDTRTADVALPLVAHVLQMLWTHEHLQDGVIALDEYLALGGISGALSRAADAVLGALDPAGRDQARTLLLALVSIQPDGVATRRVVDLAEASAIAPEHVLARLSGAHAGSNARLVVIHDHEGHHEVEIVHEALLRDWRTLRGWIEEHRESLLLSDELTRRAEHWDSRGRAAERLPAAAEARELLSIAPRGHTRTTQEAFQAAIRASFRRRRLASAGGVAAALVTVLGVGGFVVFGLDQAVPDVDVMSHAGVGTKLDRGREAGSAAQASSGSTAGGEDASDDEVGAPGEPSTSTGAEMGTTGAEPEPTPAQAIRPGRPRPSGASPTGPGKTTSKTTTRGADDGQADDGGDDGGDDGTPPPPPPRSNPTVKLSVTTKGELTKDAARAVVQPALGKVEKCYADGLKADATLEGKLTVKLSLFPGMGHVTGTTKVASSLGGNTGRAVWKCVDDVVDDLVFGEEISFGDGVTVAFTMTP